MVVTALPQEEMSPQIPTEKCNERQWWIDQPGNMERVAELLDVTVEEYRSALSQHECRDVVPMFKKEPGTIGYPSLDELCKR